MLDLQYVLSFLWRCISINETDNKFNLNQSINKNIYSECSIIPASEGKKWNVEQVWMVQTAARRNKTKVAVFAIVKLDGDWYLKSIWNYFYSEKSNPFLIGANTFVWRPC